MSAAIATSFRARPFNPETGRFLSEDPIGFGGLDTNFYRYVFNNPINLFDPYGLISQICERPLNILGGDILYKIARKPFRHEILCVGNKCEGFRDSEYSGSVEPEAKTKRFKCEDIPGDEECIDKCIGRNIDHFNPGEYGLFSNNCKHYVRSVRGFCVEQCSQR